MPASKSGLSAYLRKVLLLMGLALCSFVLLLGALTWLQTHTHRFLFRLAPAEGGVGEGDLLHATEVLSARLQALRGHLGLGRGAVQALPPDGIELQVNCRSESLPSLAWLTMQGLVEFRLLHPDEDILEARGPEGLPSSYEVKVYRRRRYMLTRLNELQTVEERYVVEREPILRVAECEEVTMDTVGSQKRVVITFRFGKDDAEAFGRLTALHAGRRMAMLIDGEMFFPPREIEAAVTLGAVQAQGFFHIPPLRRLAAALDCGSLPAPLQEVSHTVE